MYEMNVFLNNFLKQRISFQQYKKRTEREKATRKEFLFFARLPWMLYFLYGKLNFCFCIVYRFFVRPKKNRMYILSRARGKRRGRVIQFLSFLFMCCFFCVLLVGGSKNVVILHIPKILSILCILHINILYILYFITVFSYRFLSR